MFQHVFSRLMVIFLISVLPEIRARELDDFSEEDLMRINQPIVIIPPLPTDLESVGDDESERFVWDRSSQIFDPTSPRTPRQAAACLLLLKTALDNPTADLVQSLLHGVFITSSSEDIDYVPVELSSDLIGQILFFYQEMNKAQASLK